MNQRQLAEWQAYYDAFPWGEEIDDFRHGIQTAALVNVQRTSKSRSVKPQDFMIHKPPAKQQTLAQKKAVMMSLAGFKR